MFDHDLFESGLDALPRIQPTETLYSWCARFHRLSGHSRAKSTSQILFGHPSVGLFHDFPGRLDYLDGVTNGLLGDITELGLKRTQLGLFTPFLNKERVEYLVKAMRTETGFVVRMRLGVFRSDLGTLTPLRACLQCIDEDRETASATCWRMEHQWQPTWICIRHGNALARAPSHCYSPHFSDWNLPREFAIDAWQRPQLSVDQFDRLAVIARWTAWIVAEGASRFNSEWLRYTYHLQARQRGWVAFDGSLRFHQLRDSFQKAYEALLPLDGMAFLQKANSVTGGFLGGLLRKHSGAGHPLKHLYLMAFLFEEPEKLLQSYERVKEVASTDGLYGVRRYLADMRVQHVEKLDLKRMQATSVGNELNVPSLKAVPNLKTRGEGSGCQPRVLTLELKMRLHALLFAGKDRKEIVAELGVRGAFIKDYLAKQPALRSAWLDANMRNKKANYRKSFLSVLDTYPGVPIKKIRRIKGNGFDWLYRHDLDWLRIHLPSM
jgi:hypothetical protein